MGIKASSNITMTKQGISSLTSSRWPSAVHHAYYSGQQDVNPYINSEATLCDMKYSKSERSITQDTQLLLMVS